MKQLNQDDVNKLCVGDLVRVVWSGGNGPHDYTIIENRGGFVRVNTGAQDVLDFVGMESPFTRVWLLEASDGKYSG